MTTSELPPAYNSLHTSTVNIATDEETVPMCEDDAEILVNYSFEDKTTRLIFIQKVLTVKLLQLLGVVSVTTFFVLDNYEWGGIQHFMWSGYHSNSVHVFVLSTFAFIVIFGLLIYCDQARRTNPYRYMFLVAYPLSYTLLFCFTVIACDMVQISAAWYYYSAAVFALLVYSIFLNQTKQEFLTRYGILISCLVLIVMFAITVPFLDLHYHNPFYIVYGTIAAGADLVCLLHELEMMTSKNYRISMTPDDFVDAAINLHLNYYYIFIDYILPKLKHGCNKLSEELLGDCIESN